MRKHVRAKRKKTENEIIKLLRFLIKFNLFAIPLYAIIISGFTWPSLMQLTNDISLFALRLADVDASMINGFIVIPVENGNFAATVSWDSTGWKSMLAFFALIFATEFPLRKKMIGLLFIPLIYLVNVLRIVFVLFFVNKYGVLYYDFLHATLWSWGLIAAVLVLWFIWMKYAK